MARITFENPTAYALDIEVSSGAAGGWTSAGSVRQKSTADAIAGQMRDAGLKVTRKVIPAATFWNDWTKYPFSCTEWLGRPLGVQVLALAKHGAQAGTAATMYDASEQRECRDQRARAGLLHGAASFCHLGGNFCRCGLHGWQAQPFAGEVYLDGQQVHVVPNHVCPVVNLADELVVHGDRVEAMKLNCPTGQTCLQKEAPVNVRSTARAAPK